MFVNVCPCCSFNLCERSRVCHCLCVCFCCLLSICKEDLCLSIHLSVLVFNLYCAFEYVEDGFCLSSSLPEFVFVFSVQVSKNFWLSLSLFSFVFVNM